MDGLWDILGGYGWFVIAGVVSLVGLLIWQTRRSGQNRREEDSPKPL